MNDTLTTPRPNRRDPDILKAAALKLLPNVKEWFAAEGEKVEDESILADLEKAMRWDSDGYKLAKNLDQSGWDPDSQLVEILDMAGMHIRSAHEAACTQWVQTTGMVAPEISSCVTDKTHPEYGVGQIVENYPDGRSTVSFADKGHLPVGAKGPGTKGSVLDWETLIPA